MAKRKPSSDAPARVEVEVIVQQGDITQVKTDLLVVEAFEGVETFGGVTAAVDEATGGALSRVLRAGDFKGKMKETLLVHPEAAPAKRVLLVGAGKVEKFDADKARRVSAVVARKARDLGVEAYHTVLLGVGSGGLDARVAGEALAEGALLGLYKFDRYKSKKDADGAKEDRKPELRRVVVMERDGANAREARAGVEVGAVIAQATNMCRDWAQLSGADAAPARYGERAEEVAREHGLTVEVLDKRRMEQLGMGGVLAVAQGSIREPRFVVLEHKPARPKGTIVLVGKGITFDSGGISIKPSEGMQDMKMDKSGAAAVTAAVVAAARLKLPLHVVALTPYTDNLPSGSAYKPGDIVTTMSGKTIEIINTDAEGRVILSDALHYGGRYKPDAMVELSTLTGGCVIAVGQHAIAGMGNSDELMAALRKAGDAVYERVWPLPFFEEYGEMVKSKVADVKNSAGRVASSITAGKFLETFVGDHPWVHLDIASTAWHEPSPRMGEEYSPDHATGVGVRLLVQWMRNYEPVPWTPKKKDESSKAAAPARAPRKKAAAKRAR